MSAVSSAAKWLEPCGQKTGTAELAACLALVAPTGMGEAERQQWMAAAREALRGIPADLMRRGAAYARRHADHPAKVVPCIFREVGAAWENRKRALREARRDSAPALPRPAYEAIPRDITQRILREEMGENGDSENAD